MGIPRRYSPLGLVVAGAASCSAGQAAPKVTARYDTLPSGTIRVTSAEPTGWSDSTRAWRFETVARIGGADGSASELVEPSNIAIDDWGRIYVADRKPPTVKVFDSTGALVRVIGREGSGPGEFRVAFIAVRRGVLVVHDPMQSRTSVFDTAGSYLRSWKSSCCYWSDVAIDRAMRIYIPTVSTPDSTGKTWGRAYTRYSVDGATIDTLVVPARDHTKTWQVSSKDGKSQMMTGVPFTPRSHDAYHPAGGFVHAWSGDYRLAVSPTGSDTARLIVRPWTAEPIPDARREAETNETLKWVIEQYGEAIANAAIKVGDVPTTAPAFIGLRVDEDDHLWVRRFAGSDSTQTAYDVFRPDGSWLGPVVVPVSMPEWGNQYFAKGLVYAVTEDDDGRPTIVKLRIVR
jgi:hypothetical protein